MPKKPNPALDALRKAVSGSGQKPVLSLEWHMVHATICILQMTDGDVQIYRGPEGKVLGIAVEYWRLLGKPVELVAADPDSVCRVMYPGAKLMAIVMPCAGTQAAFEHRLRLLREVKP